MRHGVIVFRPENWSRMNAFIETLRYYKQQGEIESAKIWKEGDCTILEITCTVRLYSRVLDYIHNNTHFIMEFRLGDIDYEHGYPIEISHIEELRNKANYAQQVAAQKARMAAQKTKEGAKKAGKFAYEHREEIAKGAVVAAKVAPLVLI